MKKEDFVERQTQWVFFLSIAWLHLERSSCDEGACPLELLHS
jgi:hypothetical protein